MIPEGAKIIGNYGSIVHVTTGSDKDNTRQPGVWFRPGTRTLYVCVAKASNAKWAGEDCAPSCYHMKKNVQYHVKVQVMGQKLEVFINGTSACKKDMVKPR